MDFRKAYAANEIGAERLLEEIERLQDNDQYLRKEIDALTNEVELNQSEMIDYNQLKQQVLTLSVTKRSFTEKETEQVVRAFWRRIRFYVYQGDPLPRELPDPVPIEFLANMRTALMLLEK